MNKIFYFVAVIVAIILLTLGVVASRKTPIQTEADNDSGSFNSDQLQDAADKAPVTN